MKGSETFLFCRQKKSGVKDYEGYSIPVAVQGGPRARSSIPYWPFTHLGSKVFPTHGVFRAMGIIAVPPVQVQLLRSVVVRLEALDVHV